MAKICKNPFKILEITPDGEIYPCCPAYCREYSFGNIYKSSFDEVWNSQEAQKFREKLLNNDYSLCQRDICFPSFSETDASYKTVMDYPEHVIFSHDLECNASCITCRDNICRNSQEQLEILNKRIDTVYLPLLKNAKMVKLLGSGDPFASRHSQKLIEAITKTYPQIRFDIHTNGVLCSKEMLEKLNLTDKLEIVSISMHAATRKTYDKIMKNSNYDRVLENIKYLSTLKKSGKLKKLNLYFVVSLINYKEMKDFVKFAEKYDADVTFWEYRDWGTSLGLDYDNLAVYNPLHPKYNELADILQDDIFKSQRCHMNNLFKSIKPIKRNKLELAKYFLKSNIYRKRYKNKRVLKFFGLKFSYKKKS